MADTVTFLQNGYNGEVLEDLLTYTAQGNDTYKEGLIHIKAGIQHKYTLPAIKLGDIIQDNVPTPTSNHGAKGANGENEYTLTERYLEPSDFMVYLEFNPRDYEKYWKFAQPDGNLVFRELDPKVQATMLRLLMDKKNEYIGNAIWTAAKGGAASAGITAPADSILIGRGKEKYFDGVVPAAGELTEYDRETLKEFSDVKAEVEKLLDVFKFRDAQKEAMNLARIGNKYLADTEPWKIAKTDMDRVATILNISLQLVANLAIAFEPFLPFSSEKLRNMLNMDSFDWATLGSTNLLPAGHQLATPELLFEKIEDSVIEAQVQKLLDTKKANEEANYKANPIRPNIEFDDFMKLDIRVGTVLECQKVPKADKLLQFKIADGLENRTIVSGIAQHYNPEELVGKQVCFIANLAPRKLKGIVSEGMILSAENFDGSLSVVTTMKEVKPGSEVK